MFIAVFTQVCILILLISVGVIAAKTGLMTEEAAKSCTDIALIIVTPCVIIKSLIREYDRDILRRLAICFCFTLVAQLLLIVMSRLLLHDKNVKRQRILQFGSIFSNCGFMSLPLQQALLPENGTLYGSAYIIMFNLVVWSYGVWLVSGDKRYISPKKMFVNPGLIGLAIGFVIFIFSIPIPKVMYSVIDYLSALYTPVPMLIIGYHLAQSGFWKAFRDPMCLLSVLLSLIVYPAAVLGALFLLRVRGDMLVSIVISVSAPIAAVTTMFSAKFSGDTPLSVNMVSLSTVLSLISMPLMITAAQAIA